MIKGKVLLIGLDGVPWRLVRDWSAEGVLPTLAGLINRGASGGCASTIPPTSAPSWSSFVTGANPGKTGIFDFLYRREGQYQFPPVNSRLRHGRPLWSLVNDAGGKVGVVNIPMSYPVDPVDGFMISGWMTPHDATDYVHPPELAEELKSVVGNYRIYPTETFKESSRDSFFKASFELLKMRTAANLHLLKKPWDLFLSVYFDTDRILHQLWHYLDPEHPWRDPGDRRDLSGEVKDYFRQLDKCLGRIISAAGEDVTVMIMSDHGMGPAHQFVVLNNWLLRAGFINLKKDPLSRLKKVLFDMGFTLRNVHIIIDRLGLARLAEYKANYFVDHILKRIFLSFNNVDWSRTRAYSYGRMLGSLYLNVRGREPEGIVSPGREYEELRDEIIASLGTLTDPKTGECLIGRVAKREEIYHGPQLGRAPDIIIWPAKQTNIFFGLTDFGASRLLDNVYRYSGMHREEGMFIAAGPGIKKIDVRTSIVDITPTILAVMGIPIPDTMDGRVVKEIFSRDYLNGRYTVCSGGKEDGEASDAAIYAPDEEREIMDRLADLGYLG